MKQNNKKDEQAEIKQEEPKIEKTEENKEKLIQVFFIVVQVLHLFIILYMSFLFTNKKS